MVSQFILSPVMSVFVLQNLEAARFLKCQLSSWFSGTTTYDAAVRTVWMTVFHWLGMKIFAVFFALSIVECITSNSMWECPVSRNFRSMTSIVSSQNCMVESCNEVVSILSGPRVRIQNDMLHCVVSMNGIAWDKWLPRLTLSGPMYHPKDSTHRVYQPRKWQIKCIHSVSSCGNLCSCRTWCLENSLHVKCRHMKISVCFGFFLFFFFSFFFFFL